MIKNLDAAIQRIKSGAVGEDAFELLQAYVKAVKDNAKLQEALDRQLGLNLSLEARLADMKQPRADVSVDVDLEDE